MRDTRSLVLSHSGDATADYICERLVAANVGFYRFDTDTPLGNIQLSMRHGGLALSWGGITIRPEEIQTVVYRRPKPLLPPDAGDAYQRRHTTDEWAEAIEGFLAHIAPQKWINYPALNYLASHKVHQLTVAHECGLAVPRWVVTTLAEEAEEFLDAHGSEIIAKPLASGYIERARPVEDTLIYTQAINRSHIPIFGRLAGCPVLFQERLRKRSDVRLLVLDGQIAAVTLLAADPDGAQRLDIRRDNMRDVQYAEIDVPVPVADAIRRLMCVYSLRFAAIDLAIDLDGCWVFLEINPNGQWAWLDLAGASDVGSLFVEALLRGSRL